MLPIADTATIFTSAQRSLEQSVAMFAELGIHSRPGIMICQGDNLLCYYDFSDQNVYVSFSETADAEARMRRLLLRSFLCCADDAELKRFLRIFVPYVVAHELTHHLRHRYGLFSADAWHEECVANECASALIKPLYSAADRAFAIPILKNSMTTLATQLGLSPQHMISPTNTMETVNDQMAYMYYQIGWLYRDLCSPESYSLAACVAQYFDQPLQRAKQLSELVVG
jgi:hypothetical protein